MKTIKLLIPKILLGTLCLFCQLEITSSVVPVQLTILKAYASNPECVPSSTQECVKVVGSPPVEAPPSIDPGSGGGGGMGSGDAGNGSGGIVETPDQKAARQRECRNQASEDKRELKQILGADVVIWETACARMRNVFLFGGCSAVVAGIAVASNAYIDNIYEDAVEDCNAK
jgi:hypothetical protein